MTFGVFSMGDKLSINLLGDKGKGTLDTVLDWAMYIGRLLVILTETIALIVFASRFSLDRKIVDLSDEIKKNQALVAYFKQGEDTYRKVHNKLDVSQTNVASSSATVSLFEKIIQQTNQQVNLTNFTISSSTMSLSIEASSVAVLASFMTELKQLPQIASLSIDTIENRTSSAIIVVTISGQLQR